MKFGPVATVDAAGALLAHTLRAGGAVFKKGRLLEEADLRLLAEAGYRELVVARLEADDVAEDHAAAQIAAAAAGPGVRQGDAFTGRSNLYAKTRGLFVAERERIDALNRVDEAITLATLAPDTPVEAGAMVATAKIIPFAVSAAVLARALAVGEPGALLRVAPFRPRAAGLILTELPGVRSEVLARASESQRVRLERYGAGLGREIRCAHEVDATSGALRELLALGCDPILILGASAIVDRGDVIPAAVVAAGGAIRHLGMPVDPGNLLLLAEHGPTTVIGVPGCARSLKPSGFDRVLARVAADLPVAGTDLSGWGAGGLLKEVPSRPQPREHEEAALPQAIAGVVLAAGESKRMPGANKLLVEIEGIPMVARAVDALAGAGVSPVVVVTGHQSDAIRAALVGRDVVYAHNPDYRDGMSTSLRTGLEAVEGKVEAAFVCLGDMPWVGSDVITALLAAFERDDPRVCVPVHNRKRGNPVLWPARYFDAIRHIAGDQGARRLLDEFADEVCFVPVADESVNLDIDTPEALEALQRGR